MSDHRDRVPDPAALDELSRAFEGDRADVVDEAADEPVIVEQVPDEPTAAAEPTVPTEPDSEPPSEPDSEPPSEPDSGPPSEPDSESPSEPDSESPSEPDSEPPSEPDSEPPSEPDSGPTIIRIDDYSGTVAVRAAEPAIVGQPSGPVRQPTVAPHGVTDEPPDEIVVIDVEDDLPDPVYVEGSLDRDRGRTIVFIEDDDTGDVIAPDADAQRGIEPRMRERRVAVKRAQSRKRLKWVALGVATVLVVVGALALLGSPLFAVRADQVTVTGNVYTDAERLEEIVDDLVGTPALRVDTDRLERELEAISWVDTARVTVDFPHAATVEIRERAAMTTYQGPDGRFRVLDREGRVLDVIENYPFAYVLLQGPDPVDLEQGEFAPAGYAAASELAKNFTASIRGRVEYIDVTADGSRLVLVLDDGSTVFFGEARDFFAKLLRLESVLAANPEREPGPIDVSTDDVTL